MVQLVLAMEEEWQWVGQGEEGGLTSCGVAVDDITTWGPRATYGMDFITTPVLQPLD